jgi:hypothetical protein
MLWTTLPTTSETTLQAGRGVCMRKFEGILSWTVAIFFCWVHRSGHHCHRLILTCRDKCMLLQEPDILWLLSALTPVHPPIHPHAHLDVMSPTALPSALPSTFCCAALATCRQPQAQTDMCIN